jgi:hypothetical protein
MALLIELPMLMDAEVSERLPFASITCRLARTCVDWQRQDPARLALFSPDISRTHFLPASVAQQQHRRDAGQQKIYALQFSCVCAVMGKR